MSTAPKDGTIFLAWFPYAGEWRIVLWDLPVYGDIKTWCIESANGERYSAAEHLRDPSGWTALPPAPEELR